MESLLFPKEWKKRKKHDVDGNVNITRGNWCLGEKKINKLLLLAINSTS